MTLLITREDALSQVRILQPTIEDLHEADRIIPIASARVLKYVTVDTEGWTAETVPPDVKGAARLYFQAFHDGDPDGRLVETAEHLLRQYRDPALA